MHFNAIRENKILAKISESTVLKPSLLSLKSEIKDVPVKCLTPITFGEDCRMFVLDTQSSKVNVYALEKFRKMSLA